MHMTTCFDEVPSSSPQPPAPVAFESLCEELGHAGEFYLEKIVSLIEQVAPSPGRIVHVHMSKLSMRLGQLQPVLFSAVDAATHLQIAQANLTMTSAAALSFVEFVAHSLPFPISEIKTRREKPFFNPKEERPHRDFTTLVGEMGTLHSFAENLSSDVLFSITSKMLFGGLSMPQAVPASPYELQRGLNQFLFFHNNFRFDPWLEGKTPIQKLRMFEGFQDIHSFSPPDEFENRLDRGAMRSPEAQDHRGGVDNDVHRNHTISHLRSRT